MALEEYKSALVTGASSGIGAAVVRRLRARGLTVHAVARRKERLDALAQETGCQALVLDLRDTEALYAELASTEHDIVVNNAGLGRGFGTMHLAEPADIDTTIDTNVRAAIHVLRALLPGMVARKRGHVVNVSSTAALYPLTSPVYGASKGAVHLLSQNLHLELAGSGVRLTEICPGRVRTEFFEAAIDDPDRRKQVQATGIHELTAEDIADAILYALDTPWHVNVALMEIHPTEQAYGGLRFDPVERPD
jgi:NADP-dependent 3-hydroxy acid dehydrogenase YdfG